MNKDTKIGIIVIVIIAIVVGAYFLGQSSNNSGQSTTQSQTPTQTEQTQVQAISLSQVQISPLTIGCEYGGNFPNCDGEFSITGEVTNNSSTLFNTINMTVEAYDCPSTTITSSCTHIAEDKDAYLGVSGGDGIAEFPIGQTKEATGATFLVGLPPIQGNFVWNYTVTGFPSPSGLIPVTQ